MNQWIVSRRIYVLAATALFAVCLIHGLIAIPKISLTYDEADHFNYAVRFVKGHPEKIKPFDDASTMPISALNTLPRIAEQLSGKNLQKKDGGLSDIFSGRYITLLLSLLTGFFVLRWSAELYGRRAGIFSLFLFVFCPNLNAQSILVTTDAYSALFTILPAYFFWRLVKHASYQNLFWFGLCLGLAQLAKQSLTHLFFIYFLLYLFFRIKEWSLLKKLRSDLLKIALAAVIIIAVINIGFQFQQTGMPLKNYEFRSSFFKGVQKNSFFFNSIPLPFPKPYIQGLDLTKNIDEMGGGHPESSGNIYLLGQQRKGEGFWYYYFVAIFFKTPIPVLIFTLIFLLSLSKNNNGFWRNEFIPIFIIGYLLIYFDFFYKSQVGIRHIIMIFPLWYVLLGRVVLWFRKKAVLFICLLYSVISFYFYFPNLIAYTNELILPKRNAYRFLADSNIDYGQSYFWLKSFLKKHPEVRPAPEIPMAGKFIIGINDYLGLMNQHKYDWLRPFEPYSQMQHSYLLFDITENDLKTNQD